MAIRIENRFVVPAPLEQAWAILTDVPRIAPCMPGAELTEVLGENVYKGRARVKIGPIELSFEGEARLTERDPDARSSRLAIRGADARGRGNVQSEMAFTLSPEGGSTRVDVVTELTLSGSVAQYGRGSGLVKALCNQYAAQFAANLAARIERGELDQPAAPAKPVSAVSLIAGGVRSMVGRKDEPPSEPGAGGGATTG